MLTEGTGARLTNATRLDLAGASGGKRPEIVGFSRTVTSRYPTAKYYGTGNFFERTANDLSKERAVVVDCETAPSLAACRFFARGMVQSGFSEVHTLGMPSGRAVCPGSFTLPDPVRQDGN